MGKKGKPILYRYVILKGWRVDAEKRHVKHLSSKELEELGKDYEVRQFIRQIGQYQPVGSTFHVDFLEINPPDREHPKPYYTGLTLIVLKKPTKSYLKTFGKVEKRIAEIYKKAFMWTPAPEN